MNRLDDLLQKVLERGAERVFIQVPEGLKTRLQEIQEKLSKEGIDSIGSLEPCYGACDLKDTEAKRLGCDLLLHIGHSKFCKDEEIDTLYFPWYYDLDPGDILKKNMKELEKFDRIGLITSVNFYPAFRSAKDYLKERGKDIVTAEGERTREGQILGCDREAALKIEDDVDCFLYLGSGKFHPLGVALDSEKPLLVLDFEEEKIYRPEFEKFERQRHAAIEGARGSEKFGILLSTKKGQARPEVAKKLKGRLEEAGKEVWIMSVDEISPRKIEGIKVDCLVNTACPRIAVEHRTDFGTPILNPDEVVEIVK